MTVMEKDEVISTNEADHVLLRMLCRPKAEDLTWEQLAQTFAIPGTKEGFVDGWDIGRVLLGSRTSTIVFGAEGSGKTHLSCGQEYHVRNFRKSAIRFTCSELESETVMIKKAALAGLIGYLENYIENGDLTSTQLRMLATLISLGGENTHNLIDRYCFSTIPEDLMKDLVGAANIFGDYGIGAVKYVEVSQKIKNAWHKIKSGEVEVHKTENLLDCFGILVRLSGRSPLDYPVEVIVDLNLDLNDHAKKSALDLLSRDLEFSSVGVLTRWFVPTEWKAELTTTHLGKYELCWGPEEIQNLLTQRLRAIRDRRIGLDGYGYNGLDADLIEVARGNPRKYLEIVSRLLERHSASGQKITKDDLGQVLASIS